MRIVRGILIGADAQDALVRLASVEEAQALVQQAGEKPVLLSGLRTATYVDWKATNIASMDLYSLVNGEFVKFGVTTSYRFDREMHDFGGGANVPGILRITGEFRGVIA